MYDDVSFGTLPAITSAAASPITTTAITWNWTEAGTGDGFYVWTAAVGGTSTAQSATSYPMSGLTANTPYSLWVSAHKNQYAGDIETVRTALGPTNTLAKDPTYATSGDVTIQCDKGSSNGVVTLGSNVTFTFNNAFGDGGSNVGQFGYIWDTNPGNPSSWTGEQFWTSGATLALTAVEGNNYLHIRSYNNDPTTKVTSGVVLNLGPYTVNSCTSVTKISDMWPLPNNTLCCMSARRSRALWATRSGSRRPTGARPSRSSARARRR